jgi:hypothetical protein
MLRNWWRISVRAGVERRRVNVNGQPGAEFLDPDGEADRCPHPRYRHRPDPGDPLDRQPGEARPPRPSGRRERADLPDARVGQSTVAVGFASRKPRISSATRAEPAITLTKSEVLGGPALERVVAVGLVGGHHGVATVSERSGAQASVSSRRPVGRVARATRASGEMPAHRSNGEAKARAGRGPDGRSFSLSGTQETRGRRPRRRVVWRLLGRREGPRPPSLPRSPTRRGLSRALPPGRTSPSRAARPP